MLAHVTPGPSRASETPAFIHRSPFSRLAATPSLPPVHTAPSLRSPRGRPGPLLHSLPSSALGVALLGMVLSRLELGTGRGRLAALALALSLWVGPTLFPGPANPVKSQQPYPACGSPWQLMACFCVSPLLGERLPSPQDQDLPPSEGDLLNSETFTALHILGAQAGPC